MAHMPSIRKEGMLRFVLKRGFLWGLAFFVIIQLLFHPPLTGYFLLSLSCGANLVWNLMRWFIINRWYDQKTRAVKEFQRRAQPKRA